jgi:uncharacterized protein
MLTIVPVYAGIFAWIFVVLSMRVIGIRQSEKIGLGTGDNKVLERRIRIHGNFAEYVPFSLILLAFIEMLHRPAWLVHVLCLVLLTGRGMHVYGLSESANWRFRVAGMIATISVIGVAAGILLVGGLAQWSR